MTPLENPRNILGVGTLDGLERFVAGCGLDAGIRRYVAILRSQGIETCQSCEGGPGHCYPVPTVEFLGDQGEGYRAVSIAITFGLPVYDLKRLWHVHNGELEGPIWSMTFREKSDPNFAAGESVDPHDRDDEAATVSRPLRATTENVEENK
jgi:hypothetical protein